MLFRIQRFGWATILLVAIAAFGVIAAPETASARRSHASPDLALPDATDGGTPAGATATAPAETPAVTETQTGPALPGSNDASSDATLTVDLDNQVGKGFKLVSAEYLLNGREVAHQSENDADFGKPILHVWEGLLPPGQNTLEVKLGFKKIFSPIPVVDSTIHESSGSLKFTAVPGPTVIHAVTYLNEGWNLPIREQLQVDLRMLGPEASCPL